MSFSLVLALALGHGAAAATTLLRVAPLTCSTKYCSELHLNLCRLSHVVVRSDKEQLFSLFYSLPVPLPGVDLLDANRVCIYVLMYETCEEKSHTLKRDKLCDDCLVFSVMLKPGIVVMRINTVLACDMVSIFRDPS